jgi:hypothetical protein
MELDQTAIQLLASALEHQSKSTTSSSSSSLTHTLVEELGPASVQESAATLEVE